MINLILGTNIPNKFELLQTLNETPPPIVKVVETTLEDKIKSNFYKCDSNLQWIRADNAQCLNKQKVVIPSSLERKPARSVQNSSVSTPGNGYTPNNCTWYAKSRRLDLPNNLGDSINWVYNASKQGFATGSVPRAGAIGQQGMHVVYIESINSDGTVYLSEMNFDYNGGFRYRTANSSDFTYIY